VDVCEFYKLAIPATAADEIPALVSDFVDS
jgi:hypothetical protein